VFHSRVSSIAIPHKHRTRLKWPAREKRSSLLQTFTNYVFQKFTTQSPGKRREGGTGFASTVMRIRKQCLIKCSADRREPPGGGGGTFLPLQQKGQKQLPAFFYTVTSALTFERPSVSPLDNGGSRDPIGASDWWRRCPFEPGVDQSLALLNFVIVGENDSFQKYPALAFLLSPSCPVETLRHSTFFPTHNWAQ